MKFHYHLFYGVKRQLFLFSSAIILILLTIIGIVFGSTTSKTLYDLAITNHAQSTRQMLNDFQKGVTSLTNLTQNYLISPYIQESLTSSDLTYQTEKYLISSLNYPNNNYLDYCFYMNNDGTVYTSSDLAQQTLKNTGLIDRFYRFVETTYSRPLLYSDKESKSDTDSLYMVRQLRHLSINCAPGLLVVHLGPNFYSNIFTNIDIQNKCSYFLLDSDFAPAYARNADSIPAEALNYLKENYISSSQAPYFYEDTAYFAEKDDDTGFIILSCVPKKIMLASSNTFFKTILLVLLFAIGLSIPLILLMSSHFTRPIRLMANNMKSFTADSLGQPLSIHTNTELDTISSGYNQMLENILHLLQTVENNQAQLRANEYNLLLHQINPHFLYNTLDNIHMLARMNGDDKTVRLICDLSSYLRISLSKGHETITVSDELEHIQSYMSIEQIRTDNLFSYSINADPHTFQYQIPKLIIQPLVENSIKYGFSQFHCEGQIHISIKEHESQLVLAVHNNGLSIAPDIMQTLNQMPFQPLETITDTFPSMPGGYGIANVICRLKLRYDTAFSIVYESQNGTTCTITLPLG